MKPSKNYDQLAEITTRISPEYNPISGDHYPGVSYEYRGGKNDHYLLPPSLNDVIISEGVASGHVCP